MVMGIERSRSIPMHISTDIQIRVHQQPTWIRWQRDSTLGEGGFRVIH